MFLYELGKKVQPPKTSLRDAKLRKNILTISCGRVILKKKIY